MSISELVFEINQCSALELNELSSAIKKAAKKFPKKGKIVVAKEVNPADKFKLECFRLCKDWFYTLPKFQDYRWSAKHSVGLNGVIDGIIYKFKCQGNVDPTAAMVHHYFQVFFTKLPPYYANAIDFAVLSSKFEAIVIEIRTKSEHERRNSNNEQAGLDIDVARQVQERINARYGIK